MDYTVHGILQAGILEWVALPFSRGASQPRGQTQVSHIAGKFFTSWATREVLHIWKLLKEWILKALIAHTKTVAMWGDGADPGIKPESLASPALAGVFFATSSTYHDSKVK